MGEGHEAYSDGKVPNEYRRLRPSFHISHSVMLPFEGCKARIIVEVGAASTKRIA